MFGKLKEGDVPVLYQINNIDENGWNYFRLNMKVYSLFDNEKEILFYSGKSFVIIDISENEDESGLKY